jgi:two-component system CheB/CheR fusion protein
MNKKIEPENEKVKSKPYPIVAIGASAGGLEAVTQLLKNLPPDTGMAYVYIQHLDPNHESMLSTILSKATKMRVIQAEDLVAIEPDHLFIIPPDKNMSVVDGVIKLNDREPRPAINMPIDQFFVSLAEKQKEGSIGIVLSGTANDGTVGLKAIKAAGGFTFVQDESARFQSMPKSAIAEGVVDMVLSPQDIANELVMLSKKTELMSKIISIPSNNEVTEEPEQGTLVDDEDVVNILRLLKKATGVDFLHYKRSTIGRRILRRMLLYKLETAKEYLHFLQSRPGETNLLYQDLLIHVTSFFRDAETSEYLQKSLLPNILKNKSPSDPLRVWIPACSTGEEAYSMAILILEVLGDNTAPSTIQIFATDISETSITKARLGLYTKNELANVSPARLQRFFTKIDGSFRIQKGIRDLCVFAPHNIFRDPPFSRLDMISCCNLLIYLDNVLQKKAVSTFYYALNPSGFLILGKSETIGSGGHLFIQQEKSFKVYSKKHDAAGKGILELQNRPIEYDKGTLDHKRFSPLDSSAPELEKLVDEILLAHYIPASVVVNLDLEILQFRGSTGFFLEPSPGKASLNLVKMAKPGLAFELRNAVHKANKLGQTIKKSELEIKHKGGIQQVSIEVTPLKSESEERLFLVIFEEMRPVSDPNVTLSRVEQIRKLQEELLTVREDMRAIVEDQEASTEELQSANEEIISSNEELQSINEELETSKEELESTNEELMTINSELQVRNEQLAESYEYAEALLDTIREAVIVIGSDFRVKMANNSFYEIFKVSEHETEGNTLFELGNRQWDVLRLRQLLDDVIHNGSIFVGFEIEHNFPQIGNKTMLLNARKIAQKIHRQEVILLAIEDITEHRSAQKMVAERETWFRNMADNAPVIIWMCDANMKWTFINSTWLQYTGSNPAAAKGDGWLDLLHRDDREKSFQQFKTSFDQKVPFEMEYRLRRHNGEYRWVVHTGKPTFSPEQTFTGYIGSCADIHDRKMMFQQLDQQVQDRTAELQEINKELARSNGELQQFAYVASHDLQEPLRKIITFSGKLQEYSANLPDTAKTFIEKIASSSHRMTRLIDDLLNFSRISRSNRKFSRTDLNDIIKDVLIDFELIIIQKNAEVNCTKLPVIQAIPVQMEQLFHNLISNALKFSKKDTSPVINITSRMISEAEKKERNLRKPGSYVELVVSDNGIGFNNEFAEQIFTIFQRLNSKYEYPGTGIGLALCRKIALNHEGEIYGESEPEQGSRFHIILPIKQDQPNKG